MCIFLRHVYLSFWVVFITMFSGSLILYSTMSNLLLIPSIFFFISKIKSQTWIILIGGTRATFIPTIVAELVASWCSVDYGIFTLGNRNMNLVWVPGIAPSNHFPSVCKFPTLLCKSLLGLTLCTCADFWGSLSGTLPCEIQLLQPLQTSRSFSST